MNFAAELMTALKDISPDAVAQFARERRPTSAYLFNSILPEQNSYDFHVEQGYAVVRSTVAMPVAPGAELPNTGIVEIGTGIESLIKVGLKVPFAEGALIQLYNLARKLNSASRGKETLVRTMLNFVDKMLIQPQLDAAELLRAMALVNGQIKWTANGATYQVDYGFDSTHFLPTRTVASGEAYGEAGSKFWDDVMQARRILRYAPMYAILHPETMDAIVSNRDGNQVLVVDEGDDGVMTITRYVNLAGNTMPDPDRRYRIRLVPYGDEAEILNPDGATSYVPFMKRGKVLFIAEGRPERVWRVIDTGSTEEPTPVTIGYTHVGPTVEGNFEAGRFARVYTPQDKPNEIIGESVANLLPVVDDPNRLVIATTEL